MIYWSGKCDTVGCGKEKGTTNHWHVVRKLDTRIEVWSWADAIENHVLEADGVKHFCGTGHALKYISELLGEKREETNASE